MSKSRKHLSEEFKLSVIRDYYSSGMSKCACRRKYNLSSPTMLNSWLKKYGIEKEMVPLQSDLSNDGDMANRSKDDYKDENAQLKKRIRELEKALEFSRLETLARDMMIDKAEDYFGIPIRKKSGAK
ncbi:MAG: transposase [Bacteroidaceae bacterium]|nr:transposase [Bacteroidaceae bacterium]